MKCDCGNKKNIASNSVLKKQKPTKSCGCLIAEARVRSAKEKWTKHGRCGSTEYFSWQSMRRRCNGKTAANFKYYGGRGIKVCRRWESFLNFLKDMGLKPTPKHSLDRVNNNKGYFPKNCRWATKREQVLNRRKKWRH